MQFAVGQADATIANTESIKNLKMEIKRMRHISVPFEAVVRGSLLLSSGKLTFIGEFPGFEPGFITGTLIQSSISEFWGMTKTVLLENSSKF